jgi:hypothetical protein
VKPFRPGVIGKGIVNPAVPFAALTSNFSSMPFRAPPPLGRETTGMLMALDSVARSWVSELMEFPCFCSMFLIELLIFIDLLFT